MTTKSKWQAEGNAMTKQNKEIGLAIIGCGTIGRIRAEFARDYPGVGWIGLCDLKSDLGESLKNDTDADFSPELEPA